jgi:hypothetical protein
MKTPRLIILKNTVVATPRTHVNIHKNCYVILIVVVIIAARDDVGPCCSTCNTIESTNNRCDTTECNIEMHQII